MKKQLYKLLIGLNITAIALILLVSGILLYFSSSESHQIFGYSAFLFHNNKSDVPETTNHSQQYSLLIVENKNNPHVGDKATFYVRDDYSNKIQFVDIIKSITEGVAIFEGTEYTVSIDSDLFIGKVIAQNNFWGQAIASVVNTKNTFLIYSILVGCFVIISGVLVVLMIVRTKQDKSDDGLTEEDILLIQMNSSQQNEVSIDNNPKIRVEHKDGAVFPHGLSRPRLSKSNPLFEPRATRSVRSISEPPQNLGTSISDMNISKNSRLNDTAINDNSSEHEDIKLYKFDKNGNPIFLQKGDETAEELSPDNHTIVLSDNADTGELIKLTRRADTLNDILRENTTRKSNDNLLAVSETEQPNTAEPVIIPTEVSPSQPHDEFAIDPNFDFDSLVNEIIHNAEEDFFKSND